MMEANTQTQPLLGAGPSSTNSTPPKTPIPSHVHASNPNPTRRARFESEFTPTLSKLELLDEEPSTFKPRVTAMTQTVGSSMTSMNLIDSLNSFTNGSSISADNPIIASLSPNPNESNENGPNTIELKDPLTNSKLLDINMTVNLQKSMTAQTSILTERTDDESQFYQTQGGGKIYIDPSYIPAQFRSDRISGATQSEIVDLRKGSTLSNQMMIEMDPSWTPFEHYRGDLCFIAMSIIVDIFAITMTWIIFVTKDDLGNEHYYEMDGNEGAIPYPTGYELVRCLFIPMLVYTVNRTLHFIISKSVKYLYVHGEKTLFITLRSIEDCNRHFVDIAMVLLFGTYIYVICSYWYNVHREHHHIEFNNHGFDEWINADIWIGNDWLDTKRITYFMLAVFMVIYVFDIYCSAHYGFIYLRFTNYAQYHSMGQRVRRKRKSKQVTTTKNVQNDTLNATDVTVHIHSVQQQNERQNERQNSRKRKRVASQSEDKVDIQIQQSGSDPNGPEQTVSLISNPQMDVDHNINDLNYKEYNPHDDADIATLKIRRKFKKRSEHKEAEPALPSHPIDSLNALKSVNTVHSEISLLSTIPQDVTEYGSRHYSLFDPGKIPKDSVGGEVDVQFSTDFISPKSERAKRRRRSRSESDLMTTRMLTGRELTNFKERIDFARNQSIVSGASTATVSPIRPIERGSVSSTMATTQMHTRPWWEDEQGDEQRASVILELREKVNFLKATLFAKQSILDQLKLDLNEQTFIISNLSLNMKRIEREKDAMEMELMEKNDELEEKRILLQVAEDTQNQITKECDRLTRKLRNMAKSKHSRSEFSYSQSRSGLRTPSRQ